MIDTGKVIAGAVKGNIVGVRSIIQIGQFLIVKGTDAIDYIFFTTHTSPPAEQETKFAEEPTRPQRPTTKYDWDGIHKSVFNPKVDEFIKAYESLNIDIVNVINNWWILIL